MIPGYVYAFKDISGFVHLYFFKGIDDNLENIYNSINLDSLNIEYDTITYNDFNVEYIFKIKNIKSIKCKLILKYGGEDLIKLTV